MIGICMHPNVYLFHLCLEVELVQGKSYPGEEAVLCTDGVSADQGAGGGGGGGGGGVSEHEAVPGRAQCPALAAAEDLVTRGAGHGDTGHSGVVEIIDRPVVDGASWKTFNCNHSIFFLVLESVQIISCILSSVYC